MLPGRPRPARRSYTIHARTRQPRPRRALIDHRHRRRAASRPPPLRARAVL